MGAARKLHTEQENWDTRLGDPAQLAVFAGEQYHARSFWGRHPVITFVLGPLPMLLAGWTASGFAVAWIATGIVYVLEHWFGFGGEMARPQDYVFSQAIVMCVVSWFVIVFPPLFVAAWLCRITRRNALNWRWPIIGCTLLAFTAAFLWVSYHPAIVPNDGRISVGLNVEGSARWVLLDYLPKFAIGLGIGLLLVKRSQQKMLLES
jgi:hypothetical protein